MTSLLFLIPAALALGLAGLIAFMWALRSGQFDDLDGAANRILFDDDENETAEPRTPTDRVRPILGKD
jgi:cbb3-type cytochrome oxidase maturation protein